MNQKCEVWIAATGGQKALLLKEFPLLSFVEVPGYEVKYGKNRAHTLLQIALSVPRILARIRLENRWLAEFVLLHKPDLIISDNRYGLYHALVPSVFITHQLGIKTSLGPLADRAVRWLSYRFIARFSACWVPDLEEDGGWAGELSHPGELPSVPVRYIGLLSRMGGGVGGAKPECDLLLLLSGPEPQRSIFEALLLAQRQDFPPRTMLVRGLPGGNVVTVPGSEGLTVFDHLSAAELGQAIRGAAVILSRAGYSTVMDLAASGRNAILVPTPGQAEQEYLGIYLDKKGVVVCMQQQGFSLASALERSRSITFAKSGYQETGSLREAIKAMLQP